MTWLAWIRWFRRKLRRCATCGHSLTPRGGEAAGCPECGLNRIAPDVRPMTHTVEVRSRAQFLHRMMAELAGEAQISLEGDLSRCSFPEAGIVPVRNADMPRRNTLSRAFNVVVLPLTSESVEPIFKEIMKAGLKRAIIHVRIIRDGKDQMGAYDNFCTGCVATGPDVSAALLESLQAERLIWSFKPIKE